MFIRQNNLESLRNLLFGGRHVVLAEGELPYEDNDDMEDEGKDESAC